jgi:hypothetical protein
LYQRFHRRIPVPGELLQHAVCDDSTEAKTGMPEYFAQAIDPGCFHFEIGDPVTAIRKIRQPVNKVGLAKPQS